LCGRLTVAAPNLPLEAEPTGPCAGAEVIWCGGHSTGHRIRRTGGMLRRLTHRLIDWIMNNLLR